MKTRIPLLFTLLCAAMTSLQIVHAATITVMNANDSGAGSLRQAIADAAPGDTIDFSVTTPGTITLSSGQLEVNANVMIDGPGADMLAVDANHTSRVFHINSGKTVTISGLTITNGTASGKGGGIYNDHATLTVSDCTVSGNSAAGFSGGGGVHNEAFNGTATLTISNSTFSGNSAGNGGAIGNNGGNGTATLTIKNTTLSGNSASNDGGGIFNFAAFVTIGDTILKTGASGVNIASFNGPVTSLGYNLSNDGGGGFLTATGDQINTDPMLGPLRNNGGLTFTHGLLAGSPAIDQGKNLSGATTDQRGAGFPRTVDDPSITNASGGDGTDIGSFEGVQPVVCPQGQGYWKNNPDAWPVESLMLGSQTYTKAELLNILRTPIGKGTKADASLILADQLIAAKLNIANGADGTPVTSTIADADAVLSLYPGKLPYRVRPNTTNGQRMVNDAATLESFNKGLLTPGCGPRHIYWTNDIFAPNGTVGRASVDGSGVNESFITGADTPFGVAVDSSHIYWANVNLPNPGTIGRANLDGTGVNQSFITGLSSQGVQGVAVDSGHIYWVAGSRIGRANLDGTGVNQSFITGVSGPGVAVDSGHIYWTNFNPGTIGRANLDGTGVNQSFITGGSFPVGVAVDSGQVYWTNSATGVNTIGRANLDGTGVNQNFIATADNPTGVAVDSGHIYWANRTSVTIGRANLDGTGVNQSFITLTTSLFMIAVDAQP